MTQFDFMTYTDAFLSEMSEFYSLDISEDLFTVEEIRLLLADKNKACYSWEWPDALQSIYEKLWTHFTRLVISSLTIDKAVKFLDDEAWLDPAETCLEDFEPESEVKILWVGSQLSLAPSEKMYTPWANSNVTQLEADIDQGFWDHIEESLFRHDVFLYHYSGDVFIVKTREKQEQ